MLKFGNKEFRNLQEQVYKNMRDILFILQEEGVLNQFGIKVIGQEESVANIPSVEDYKENNPDWAYGDAYAIGTEDPYSLYILTRANGTHPSDYWFDIGEFPVAGPEGPQGETGPQGPQGPQGNPGANGAAAGFGSVTATATTLDADEEATVSVTASGPDTSKSFSFTFGIPKGENGESGTDAVWGNITGSLSDQTDLVTALQGKQNTLVSGTNIKTINSESLLGSGDLGLVSTGNVNQTIAGIKTFSTGYKGPMLAAIENIELVAEDRTNGGVKIRNALPYTSGNTLGTANVPWKNIYFSDALKDGHSDYGLTLPDTTSFTENKTIATADQLFSGSYNDLSNKPTLGTAAAKDFTTSVTSGSSDLVTSGAVFSAIEALPEPMIFKGSVGDGGTVEWINLPTAASINKGFTYKVITAHDTAPICEIGDTIISDGTVWTVIPSGDEPSGTVTSVGLSMPTGFTVSNSPITSSGTLAVSLNSGYNLLNSDAPQAIGGQKIFRSGVLLDPFYPLSTIGIYKGHYLPAPYYELEYIYKTSGTSWIDTGIKGNINTKVELKFKYISLPSSTSIIFGSRGSSSTTNAFSFGVTSSHEYYARFGNNTPTEDRQEYDTNIHVATNSVDGGYLDDTKIATYPTQTDFETPYSIALFASRENDGSTTFYAQNCRIYYCKIWQGEQLVRDLIPCSDGYNVGFYDKVSSNFFKAEGSGMFEEGPEITNPAVLYANGNNLIFGNSAFDKIAVNNIIDTGSASSVWATTKGVKFGNSSYIVGNNSNELGIKAGINIYFRIGDNTRLAISDTALVPRGTFSLGTSSYFWNNLYMSGVLRNSNTTYGLALPTMSSWTANKTIATTDQILGSTTETWTFTLSDNTTVTKTVVLG